MTENTAKAAGCLSHLTAELGTIRDEIAIGALREKLAELAHSQWSGWMEYLFEKGEFNGDGTWTMPQWAVERWKRQMTTEYKDLSHTEKESDRKEADKFLEAIQK